MSGAASVSFDSHGHQALATWLRDQGVALDSLAGPRKLSGGAIQENWALDAVVNGQPMPIVVRMDAPSGVSESWGRAEEFALLRTAFSAGVTVPEPLWLGPADVLGRPFFVMRRVEGSASGHRLVRDPQVLAHAESLVQQVGVEMAKLHTVMPLNTELDFLRLPRRTPAQDAIEAWRCQLDAERRSMPLLEWGMRWLERHEPEPLPPVLVHRDFRTGNIMVHEGVLTAILDWEFAAWADPREDLGWFCARCWRFGQVQAGREAGGIGSRRALLTGYHARSPLRLAEADLHYWEVFAHVRWAMIAFQQGLRHESGREPSLELALTAHIIPELEHEILRMTLEHP
jgi:aminoglycoside phosphotransferase (APT) family kinase protein